MPKRKAWSLNIGLQTALVPLYLVSKLCCLNAFTYLPLKGYIVHGKVINNSYVSRDCSSKGTPNGKLLAFSIVGVLHAVGCSFAYASYHILSSLSQSSKLTDSNLVRVAIDLKNQYVGCILVLVLVTVSLFRQPALNRLIHLLLRVDQLLPKMTGAVKQSNLKQAGVNNAVWLRNVLLMLVLGVGVKATLEITNCLMYIRDSGSPFSSNCLLLCIIPQTLCVISELQFVAYALLIRDRLRLLNQWLLQLQPHLVRGSASAFESAHHLAHIHGMLVNAIGLLNRCFGVQNAILLLFQFVTLVELGYNTCMMSVRYAEAHTQQGDSTEDFLETVYWIVWFVMEMFAVCYFSHATVEEAQRTARLLRPPNAYRMNLRNHFRLISQQQLLFLNLKTCITCGGLFTVDLTLLYAIIGATTTYLIILIQFDQSFNGD
ncbi:putative gustatory receptor 28b [Anopheles maculipalpis]|uniref:putative gustatory receptor 28b n=1 Tax=Anopheles maculipalpis TaxID=1496333 RepID=UPI0021596274|nr:putative gustatory receptor 28b [Anopheles maculipalpis]